METINETTIQTMSVEDFDRLKGKHLIITLKSNALIKGVIRTVYLSQNYNPQSEIQLPVELLIGDVRINIFDILTIKVEG